jgi:hypothetical protein
MNSPMLSERDCGAILLVMRIGLAVAGCAAVLVTVRIVLAVRLWCPSP